MDTTMCVPRSHLPPFEFPIPESILEFESYPKITNYVATVSLKVQFNLNSLVLYLSSTDRKPSRFAAMAIKVHPTTCLLFSSGNMVITGGRTEMGVKLAAHVYRLMLEKIPQPVLDKNTGEFIITTLEDYTSFDSFKVVNIVGSGKLFQNNQVHLGSLSKDNISLIGWDAQIFPGLRFNIERNATECPIEADELMAHIFQGANDVIMGARVKEDIYKAHIFLKRAVVKYLNNPLSQLETAGISPAELISSTRRTDPKKKRGRKSKAPSGGVDYAKEHTQMLQNALKSQNNISFDGGIRKKQKSNKAIRIRNPNRPRAPSQRMSTHRGAMSDVDDDNEVDSEIDTAKQLFTETCNVAITREVPDFEKLANEDQDFMSEFMEEFIIND